jgi:hypothetical protein
MSVKAEVAANETFETIELGSVISKALPPESGVTVKKKFTFPQLPF